ncbi:MAG: PEP-utilizing enzyme [Bacteroidetes bacterium]|nr:PEP-utilizing enzyme [Bacteroidota bacterium]
MRLISSKDNQLSAEGIGGKAKNLFKLQELGFRVPNWLVIPQELMLEQMPASLNDKQQQELIDALEVPTIIMEEIESFFGSNFEQQSYAVRSSAMDEDGKEFSFAGQFESYLHVSAQDLVAKIKAVWKSAASERVQHYRKTNNLDLHFGIAVIIQEMVSSEVAGVAFGADPINGARDTKLISAVYGLGEGLVSGDLNADTFRWTAGSYSSELALKEHQYVQDLENGGCHKIAVPAHQQNKASLDAAQIAEIVAGLALLEEKLGLPQDIEFAYANGQFYLTQTRPITSLKQESKGDYILWDNSNIIESYPGITTPLTFSFIRQMYEMVYRQFVQLMGVRAKDVNRNAAVFENTLGLVRGRVYYNLLNWYKMLAMLPGYTLNAENMERMMGVKERFDLGDEYKMSKGLASLRILFMLLKMLLIHFQLPAKRRKFQAHLNRVMSSYQQLDFSGLKPKKIIEHYNAFEKSLLLEWKAPLINDFFAMIWFGMLEKQSQKLCPDSPNLHNDLLCGSQDIISVEPIHRSMAIAGKVAKNEALKKLFLEKEALNIWSLLDQGHYPEIKEDFDAYIAKFGDRCVGELKLESKAYAQHPELFVKLIKSYVQQGISQRFTKAGLEDELREAAEKKIADKLRNRPFKKWWFQLVLRKTRDLVSNRENLRFERTRGFGMVRHMFLALGERWFQEGHLKQPRDMFYLELEEIKQLENESWNEQLKARIAERKLEFSQFAQQPLPQERFYTYGYEFKDEYIYSLEKLEGAEDHLEGIGCCPGIVQGKVRVVHDPNEIDSLNGDILLTTSTDPGWVTLFPTASAIIVERGSLLSHSAIVSREMGIPCIVSVKGLLRTLKTGDQIMMDGSTGQIKLIDNG